MTPNDERMTYDCFLSHNSKDKPAVRALAKRLADAGISVWLDEEQIRPGVPWQPQLEAGIRASRSVAVLVGSDGMGPWQDEEQQAVLVLAVRDRRPVIPVLLADAPSSPDLPLFLQNRTWVDLRADVGKGTAESFKRLLWGITGIKDGTPQQAVSQSRSRLGAARRQTLQQTLALLQEQYAAALQQSATIIDAVARVQAEQQVQQLKQRICDIERALKGQD